MKPGRKEDPAKDEKVEYAVQYMRQLLTGKKKRQPTVKELTDVINAKFKANHNEKTVRGWLNDRKRDTKFVAEFKEENAID